MKGFEGEAKVTFLPEYVDATFAKRVAANLRQGVSEMRRSTASHLGGTPNEERVAATISLVVANLIDAVTKAIDEETEA